MYMINNVCVYVEGGGGGFVQRTGHTDGTNDIAGRGWAKGLTFLGSWIA